MAKLKLSELTRCVDALLNTTENPLHRQILEVFRRHILLELTGRYEEILAPDMMVEHPIYRINAPISLHTNPVTEVFDGRDAVRAFYASLTELKAPVMTTENESLAVADWGFASESIFHHQIPGGVMETMGLDIDDPSATYVLSYYIVAIWHFDEHARLISEHLYQASPGSHTVTKLAPEDVITLEEARAYLEPLIRPIPVFDPSYA